MESYLMGSESGTIGLFPLRQILIAVSDIELATFNLLIKRLAE